MVLGTKNLLFNCGKYVILNYHSMRSIPITFIFSLRYFNTNSVKVISKQAAFMVSRSNIICSLAPHILDPQMNQYQYIVYPLLHIWPSFFFLPYKVLPFCQKQFSIDSSRDWEGRH